MPADRKQVEEARRAWEEHSDTLAGRSAWAKVYAEEFLTDHAALLARAEAAEAAVNEARYMLSGSGMLPKGADPQHWKLDWVKVWVPCAYHQPPAPVKDRS